MNRSLILAIILFPLCAVGATVQEIGFQQTWATNSSDGSITNVNGGGVEVSGSLIQRPFIGYNGAGNTGLVYSAVLFGDSSNAALAYTESYINVTNTDGSIDTVFRRGINQQVQTGPTISRMAQLTEQQELHYFQLGFGPACEWHFIFTPTNGTEQRWWTTQFNETNGFAQSTISLNSIAYGLPGYANRSVQLDQSVVSSNPQAHITMNNGSFFDWSYPNDGGLMMQAEDNNPSTHILMQWSPSAQNWYFVPNNDTTMVINGPLFFGNNTGIGQSGGVNNQPKFVITANGGVSAGGVTDPGAGIVQATNYFSFLNSTVMPVMSGNNTALVSSNKVLFFVTATKTNLVSDGR